MDITATMDGTLLNWLKDVGDPVTSGDIVAEMDADKATVEIEAPGDGVLLAQSVQPGDAISEGAVIGQIGEAGAQPAAPSNGAKTEKSQAAAEPESEPEPEPEASASNGAQEQATTDDGRVKISPLARRMAEERGIDLNQVTGSGPGGRIVKADIEDFKPGQAAPARKAAAPSAPAQPGAPLAVPDRTAPAESDDVEYVELTTMRRRIAAGTIESQQTIPHFYVTTQIDVGPLLALRKQLNASVPEDGTRISVNDLVVKAAALTLRQFPNLNSHFYGDKIVHFKRINIGIAVALPGGGVLYVVAHDADKVALGTLAADNKAKALRAREGKVKPDDMRGATFSTSNLGIYDVDHFAAIINPPEAGVLAFGTAKQVPIVNDDGTLGVGQRMNVTISVDHRISDGAEGAEFLQALKNLLEDPMRLLI